MSPISFAKRLSVMGWVFAWAACGCGANAWGLQVDIRDFGAVDGDQTLVAVDYWTRRTLPAAARRPSDVSFCQSGSYGGSWLFCEQRDGCSVPLCFHLIL
jgi:hypothetical protein